MTLHQRTARSEVRFAHGFKVASMLRVGASADSMHSEALVIAPPAHTSPGKELVLLPSRSWYCYPRVQRSFGTRWSAKRPERLFEAAAGQSGNDDVSLKDAAK